MSSSPASRLSIRAAGIGAALGAFSAVVTLLALDALDDRPVLAALAVALIGALTGRVIGHRVRARVEAAQRVLVDLALSEAPEGGSLASLGREGRATASAIERLRSELVEARRAEAALAERFAVLVEGLGDGVLIVDRTLTVLSLNRAAAELLRVERDQAVGQSLVVVTRDADIVRVTRDAVAGGAVQVTPIDFRREERQLNVRVQALGAAEARLAIVVLQDLTEVRRLESVRRDFVANVSHELRTPVAAIRALAETLEGGALEDPEVGPDFVRRIVSESERMTRLIDGLIDLGRLQAGRMALRREPTDFGALVRGAVERVRPLVAEQRFRLSVEVEEGLPPILLDPARIDQVVTNLLHNAVKFTPSGGEIAVRVRRCGRAVRLDVRDTGVGIAPEDVDRVFERFFKSDAARHSEGSGLGLAIAKHIVLAHGGQIRVESALGKGSTFTVELPAT